MTTDTPSPHDATKLFAGATAALGDGPTNRAVGGRYHLVEPVGEGGMGSVWRARQSEPVVRDVAVKLIKPGMDSKQVLARFDAERQALARMDHPNIATVLDGGLDGGRPYFVMELVAGVPITDYCDARKLTADERLKLFVPVCRAIQHAHQKGVVHRDIKPSNVLVADYDGVPTPKVIDFGVAKATGVALTAHTIDTLSSGVVGTPHYMSPEQATLGNLDIDTRSDVYSLGVLLYELLAGGPPFKVPGAEVTLFEVLRMVREDDPPRPSARVGADAGVAAARGSEPRRLAALYRRELDWVVTKSLEKDRARRYETPAALAEDAQRYLAGEPVAAHPPARAYRLRKLLRRHRVAAVTAGLVALALVLGLAGTTWGLVVADAARRDAEAANRRSLTVLASFTDELMEKQFSSKAELTENERSILRSAVAQWEVFASGGYPAARAEGAYRVGLLQEKLGLRDDALANYALAAATRARLGAADPGDPDHLKGLADSQNRINLMLRDQGDLPGATAACRAALAARLRLVAEFPATPARRDDLAASRNNLGHLLALAGEFAAAEAECRAALGLRAALAAEFPAEPRYRFGLASCHNNLGDSKLRAGDRAGAGAEHRVALTLRRALADEFPAKPEYRDALATSRGQLGHLHLLGGDLAAAAREFRAALELRERLAEELPAVPWYRAELAKSLGHLGALRQRAGDHAGAAGDFRRAAGLFAKLAAAAPGVTAHAAGATEARSGALLALLTTAVRSPPAAARTLCTEAIALLPPGDPALRGCHEHRAIACENLRDYAGAAADWGRAAEFAEGDARAGLLIRRATALAAAGRVAEAVAAIEGLPMSGGPASQWYDVACVYAVAHARGRGDYAGRAVAALRRAVERGWDDESHTARDPDLAAIRYSGEYRAIVGEMAARRKPEAAPRPRLVGG